MPWRRAHRRQQGLGRHLQRSGELQQLVDDEMVPALFDVNDRGS
jgi:hypothetical protein